jgi:hypothetical protein
VEQQSATTEEVTIKGSYTFERSHPSSE